VSSSGRQADLARISSSGRQADLARISSSGRQADLARISSSGRQADLAPVMGGPSTAMPPAAGPATTTAGPIDDLSAWEFEPEADRPPPGRAPQLVALDIGEVIIDESRVWDVWSDVLGISRFTMAAVLGAAIAQGLDHTEAFAHVAPNVQWQDFLEEHERRYGGFQPDDIYADVIPCLTELKELGVRVALAGNQPDHRTGQLRELGLPVDWLATSADLGCEKPDPGFFRAVLGVMDAGDPSEVLYVGDRVDNDIIPATRFGMRTCWLRRGPWGQLQDLPDDVQPDLVLEGLGELPLLLQGWIDEDEEAR